MTKLLEMGAVTAYGLALREGFVGTLQEWLDSLHARIGKNGNWWVGNTDTGVLADPAKLRLIAAAASSDAASARRDASLAINARYAAENARERAEDAVAHSPMPNAETETWWVWDASASAYVDTGLGYSATDEEVAQIKIDLNQLIDTGLTVVDGRVCQIFEEV